MSLRTKTFFYKSHLSIFKIVALSYLCLQNTSKTFIMREKELNRFTVVDWTNFCREVIYDGLIIRNTKIGGEGIEVEVDENKYGKRKYNK